MAATLAGCGAKYPNCSEDADCHDGEFCVNNTCQMCRDTSDCEAGNQCVAGRCDPIPGYCDTQNDCEGNQECVNNRCVQPQQSQAPAAPAPAPAPSCQLQPVYFDYDSATLSEQSREQLNTAAQCARQQGLARIHVTGMTDPRGTEEYNLALGDRRAKAAETYLKSLGLQADITTSSMGREMATGTNEAGWSRDRRVEIQPR